MRGGRGRFRDRAGGHADPRARVTAHDEHDLIELVRSLPAPLLLVLDCVQDPHNLGACLRTADAAGAHAVVAPRHECAPLTDTVRRIACGAAEKTFFAQVTNLARTLRQLQEAEVRVVGADRSAPRTIYETDLRGPLALVMGSEGKGLRRLTAEVCDELASVPMAGSVECLNVSVATGVCLFEAVRQRGRRGTQNAE